MRVTQMLNRTGRPVANQFILIGDGKEVFQSYETRIAEVENGDITLDTKALEYSNTTSKYLYMFLNMNKQQIQKGIKNGSIKTKNLNQK